MGNRFDNFAFKVLDYTYGDPGEPIEAAWISSSLARRRPKARSDFLLSARQVLSAGRNRRQRALV